ncbi:ABC transporter-related protein [Leptothrix cholodnii SP-6]|uniref:ABC transporter-related protein n=1 Tax=Leptothrix cholodnii (strain ATCC 51168 / LMG 8142 / SP-6) TaxID=395495 RepID=B1Y4B1_LEPCP|nr:ABC transporter ATP-binding protein [Leptothrix cholodnii]ACB35812.1 ABC transporter-related protein [Leptothrix cholodnii SP-6]
MGQVNAASPVLALAQVRFRWPGAARDVIDIDELTLAAGQTLFLRGPSGCGKSTLLSLAAGVQLAGSGTASLLGRSWSGLSASARDRQRAAHIGYIFQQFNLLPYLSVLDNVLLPCRLSAPRAARAGANPAAQRARAEQLLGQLGLGEVFWSRRAVQLSVGQQQRVAAARALIGAPELVIADEPTSALDETLRESFMAVLLQACADAGSALLFVSHDTRLAAAFDRQLDLPSINRAAADSEVAA